MDHHVPAFPALPDDVRKKLNAAQITYGIDFLAQAKQLISRRQKFEDRRRKRLEARAIRGTSAETVRGDIPVMVLKKKRLKDSITPIKRSKLSPRAKCTECKGDLNGNSDISPLCSPVLDPKSTVVKAPVCIGCDSLVDTMVEKEKLTYWVVTGELSPDLEVEQLTPIQQYMQVEATAESFLMIADAAYDVARGPVPKLVHQDEIRQLYRSTEGRDNVLGHRLPWSESFKTAKEHYSILELDCIQPLWAIQNEDDYYSIKNIQILSKAMKAVKKNATQDELLQWLGGYIRTKKMQLEQVNY
ncbi:hypothetical protein G6F57_009495 [Rhizopus arrhizus]|uniref:Uncharacterized protein n=1 Tax=Rhizopus oryzae TaxID=64495 RepID=A0A9P7BNK2_RHIOR|nr:hypothetical protein G6F23_007816 [Rhizopus arrhizus]KAG1415210.1 hypothetical protein G6F58_006587 [Rhizopus delemar]KAG0758080.1 hypothetical protein G6F24_010054 [Rhizopus arrhizus]KAG0785110.1 hypothetical protein G6F21_009469 [Rhizopus arrhizus]KAG0798546.1 hypothetical protein G6F22_004113 [Rhizopus arrhizus]